MTLAKGTPTIIRGSDYFFNNTYEGNGRGQRVGNFIPFTDSGTIAKSIVSNRADNSQLNRTISSSSQRRIFTISLWCKLSTPASGTAGRHSFFTARQPSNSEICYFMIDDNGRLSFQSLNSGGSNVMTQMSNRTFEDTSKFYHFMVAVDTTQSTNTNKIKMYVDGDQITDFSYSNYDGGTNYDLPFGNDNSTMYVGEQNSSNYHLDGYMAEFNIVDGTAYTPSTFGLTDTSTGRWIPKSLAGISYGTHGARFEFANSAGQTIGDDTSGQGNDFTVSGFATTDVTTDSPTDLYPTLMDFQTSYPGTYSEGNLRIDGGTNSQTSVGRSTLTFDAEDSTGYYWEVKNIENNGFGQNWNGYGMFGVDADNSTPSSGNLKPASGSHVTYRESGNIVVKLGASGTEFDGGTAYFPKTGNNSSLPSGGDTIGIAVKGGKVWFAKNGNWINPKQGHPGLDGTPAANNVTGRFRAVCMCYHSTSAQEINFGQRLTLGGTSTSDYSANNGGRFVYNPPVGFRAIKQDNLPETTRSTPDFVWAKSRDNTESHVIYDTTRGVQKMISPNNTTEEGTQADGLQKFLKGGFATEDHERMNQSGISYANWSWIANGGTTSANTDGSGATQASTIQANQTAGFSIVTFSSSSSPSGTYKIAHGLGAAPQWIIGKNLENSGGYNWTVFHHKVASDPATDFLRLNTNASLSDNATVWGDTSPTSTVFTVGTGVPLLANEKTIFYCWTGIPGFSKFGSYTGNGNSNGQFINVGFKPSWIMIKETGNSNNWPIWDNKRFPLNPTNNSLFADLNQADNGSSIDMDVLSNGFKCRTTNSQINRSGGSYIYMAFAEHPFLGDGTNPATAR